MVRQIVLDTETTGFDPFTGDRLVEVGCLEVEDFVPTGRSFHRYIDPCRDMPAGAEKVHGLSAAFLRGKPRFEDADICDALLDFIGDAQIIAHNAAFDRTFLNWELEKAGRVILEEVRWIDTLDIARTRFPGAHNSLDALCKRFKISLADREKHGALIDAQLLAEVYLELQGGRERALDLGGVNTAVAVSAAIAAAYGLRPRPLAPLSTEAERAAHAAFLETALKGKSLWSKLGA
jgi:DNA polymerase III subunit epsilon